MACRPMPPSEQPRVFISYARKDGAALAYRLHFPRHSRALLPAPAATFTSSASKNRKRRAEQRRGPIVIWALDQELGNCLTA
jgi:hypothetical protein